MASRNAIINRPDVYDALELPPNVKKIEYQTNTQIPNCVTFFIALEDHTIGDVLRMYKNAIQLCEVQLLKDDSVLFAGYKISHPLERKLELKIQTKDNKTPFASLYHALKTLQADFSSLRRNFKQQAQELKSRQATLRR